MTDVYSDTWSWLKLDKKDYLMISGHIKERLNATITVYELNKKKEKRARKNR